MISFIKYKYWGKRLKGHNSGGYSTLIPHCICKTNKENTFSKENTIFLRFDLFFRRWANRLSFNMMPLKQKQWKQFRGSVVCTFRVRARTQCIRARSYTELVCLHFKGGVVFITWFEMVWEQPHFQEAHVGSSTRSPPEYSDKQKNTSSAVWHLWGMPVKAHHLATHFFTIALALRVGNGEASRILDTHIKQILL